MMKKISLQWRLTIIISVLIAAICVLLNVLLYNTGIFYIDSLGNSVLSQNQDPGQGQDTNSDQEDSTLYIEFSQEDWRAFAERFSIQVDDSKKDYSIYSWILTVLITLAGGGITYLVSGYALRPLRKFSDQAAQIQAENLTDCRLDEEGVPEFRRLGESFNRMLDNLSESFSALREFNGSAAHEFRTPLAIMQAQIELYEQEEHENVDQETEEMIAMMKEQTSRLSHLVKSLLDMSELQTIPRTDPVELQSLIEEVLADLSSLAEKNGVQLMQKKRDDLIYTGSDILLYRMLFNLTENAIRYNHPGGCVTLSAEENADHNIRITVADTGQGIPKEAQERIFQPFYRVDKSRSRAFGGVGLGLALVQKIAELHGGAIRIAESSEMGSTFEICLPEKEL